jgi:ipoprotein LpqH
VKKQFPLVAGMVFLSVGVTVGCSSTPPPAFVSGALPGGQAEVKIDERDAASTHAVSCQSMPWFRIVTIGDGDAGATAYLSNEVVQTTDFVSIRNLGGFTGSYNAGHDEVKATVGMTGSTYEIKGTARGTYIGQPGTTTTGTFAITVAC